MRLRHLFASGLLLTLASCKSDPYLPTTQAPCYTGVVQGTTCYDGVLIAVDAQHQIGKPISWQLADSSSTLPNTSNVLGALNVSELGSLSQKGQHISFSCTGDTLGFSNFGPCTAVGVPLSVPHAVLTSFSATPCTTTSLP